MLAAYGVDVLDPGVSLRRVWVLLHRLPPWARRPGEDWSTEAELLALLSDQIADLTWLVSQLGGGKSARPRPLPRPAPRRRPGPAAEGWKSEQFRQGWVQELTGMAGVVVKRG